MTRLAIIAAFLALGACATTGTAPPASDSAKAAAPAVSEDPAAQLAHVVELKANLGEGESMLGSGFLHKGTVITNAHVVADANWVDIYDQSGDACSVLWY